MSMWEEKGESWQGSPSREMSPGGPVQTLPRPSSRAPARLWPRARTRTGCRW